MFGYLQPSADRTEDGVEVWDLLEDSGFSETGLAPLIRAKARVTALWH
jgi:hypothetical protein